MHRIYTPAMPTGRTTDERHAVERGARAFADGYLMDENPHRPGTVRWHAWCRGWSWLKACSAANARRRHAAALTSASRGL